MFKKIFILNMVFLILAGCSSAKKSYMAKNTEALRQAKSMLQMAAECKKDVILDQKFCSCVKWASDESGSLEYPLSNKYESEEFDSLVIGLVGYFNRLSSCEVYAPINLDFEIPYSDLAKRIVKDNDGYILTPDLINNISVVDEKVGWKFKMYFANKKDVNLDKYTFTYKGAMDGASLFDYIGSSSSGEYKYENGYKYFKKDGDYTLSDEESCKFVIGECVYKVGDRFKKKYTKFIDGFWISNDSDFGVRSRAIEINVYDLSGLPLYRSYMATGRNVSYEEVRYERDS